MTRYDPTLFLSRLCILKDQVPVFDERFHPGVNIIRGRPNSVGKSTILNAIYFVLGGEEVKWVEHALKCTEVVAEVVVNGERLTLQREISESPKRPIAIFWGTYERAMTAGRTQWQTFPFSATANRRSFSQTLFSMMGVPEARETESLITMNQLLRLMYADQVTSPRDIFRYEPFDSYNKRDAAGSLVCGIYDDRLYQVRQVVREKKQRLDQLHAEIKSAFRVFSESGTVPSVLSLTSKLEEARVRLASITAAAAEPPAPSQSTPSDVLDRLQRELQGVRREYVYLQEEISKLDYEIADSEEFVVALQRNLDALKEAALTRSILGEIEFQTCPSCHSALAKPQSPDHCGVCGAKRPDNAGGGMHRLAQQVELQLTESEILQAQRVTRRAALDREIKSVRARLNALQSLFDQTASRASTTREAQIADLNRKLGYAAREVEDVERQLQIARGLERLQDEAASLDAEVKRLIDEEQSLLAVRQTRQRDAYQTISDWTVKLLREDNGAEEAFQNATSIQFEFGLNQVKVDHRDNISASSLVVLRNSFHLGMLFASLEHAFFRLPRLALFDSIEDKGMVPDRSHNFQRLMVRYSEASEVEHQIIYSTSMIPEDLEKSGLTVGRFFTPEHKSLAI